MILYKNNCKIKKVIIKFTDIYQYKDMKLFIVTIKVLEKMVSIFNPKEFYFLSQDNTARVLLGLAEANKQTMLHM